MTLTRDNAGHGVPQEFVVHEQPVWRARANFLIHAELPQQYCPKRFEQLWARHLGDDMFEVCCIPFFIYDLALGDVVATSAKSGRKYVIDKVVTPSGRYVFRAWFGQSFQPRDEIAGELKALGSLSFAPRHTRIAEQWKLYGQLPVANLN
jgi:Domain of unknown function (DUF4265)